MQTAAVHAYARMYVHYTHILKFYRESVRVRVAAVSSKHGDWICDKKCERVILSIEDKIEVIDILDHVSSLAAIAAKYSIAKSTVSDIKNNKAKILAFKREMADMGMSLKAKTMRLDNNYHYNYIIIILGDNVNFAMLQLSELFTYPNTPLPKGGRDK